MNTNTWVIRLCFMAYGLTFASWASRIPQMKAALELSDADLGKILFALPVGQLLSLQVSGKVATHFGSQRVLPLGLMAYALVLQLIGLSSSALQLGLSLFLFGLCGNLTSTSLHTQAVLSEKRAGRPLLASCHGLELGRLRRRFARSGRYLFGSWTRRSLFPDLSAARAYLFENRALPFDS